MPRVSVLQLDTDFPRIAGDVGSADSYLAELEVIRVGGAHVADIVSARPDLIDIAPFEDALARATGDVIVTSCGFLSYWQGHLAALTDKPFIASALTALDRLADTYTPDEILTLTFDADSLTPQHFGTHADYAHGRVGLPPEMHLRQVIARNQTELDAERVTAELVPFIEAAQQDRHRHILLECTNLPPYAPALRAATGLPVTDILTCIEAVLPGAVQPRFLP